MTPRYAEALAGLARLALFGMQPGTERLAAVLARLGDPQLRVPALHIAGTNGKGSTATYAAQLLLTAAQAEAKQGSRRRIGLYTSPHLLRVRERIQLSDAAGQALRPCEEDEFAEAVAAVRGAAAAAPAIELTFFEVLTAAAFRLFAERGVEIAVIETGLGGRLDATRLCAAEVTVITSIGLDHTEVLGPTLGDIAREKAGIFRPGVPALAACTDPAARAVLIDEARRVGAPLWLHASCAEPGVAVLPALPEELRGVVPLPGEHQLVNAALALGAVSRLSGPLGALLRRADVQREGLAGARWPGRLERLAPPGGAAEAIWLDAAHNPEGVSALTRWLDAALGGRPLTVLFGAVAGKDVLGMVGPLLRAEAVVLTVPPSPRGLPVEILRESIGPLPPREPGRRLEVVAGWREALDVALKGASPRGWVLVYGSIFLIAAVRGVLLGEQGDPFGVQDPVAALGGRSGA
jgi:dihydrofolate synthase/folylpolyglutamate synthase